MSSLLGIVLIWVVYASNVMRFRWSPEIIDSVLPCIIGIVEFMLIQCIAPQEVGLWLIFLAIIFGLMEWGSHTTMKRARMDGDNDSYFRQFTPAVLRDFIPQIAIVCTFLLLGCYLAFNPGHLLFALIALIAALVILCWQLYRTARFWSISMNDDSD